MDCPALAEWDTQLPADSVEAFPLDRSLFVCGTYRIDGPEHRVGRLHLLAVEVDGGALVVCDAVDCPGVFDVKWAPVGEDWCVTVAASDGALHFYTTLDGQSFKALPALACKPDLEDANGAMALCVDWGKAQAASSALLSFSSGHLALVHLSPGATLVTRQWKAHGFDGFGQETWCAAFDTHADTTTYSGADDCLLKRWDLRCAAATASIRHDMGITCLAPHPSRPHLMAYGSYDEHLRIVDVRHLRRELASYRTEGGGVWRAKWHPSAPDRLCVAAMHAGATVLQLAGEVIHQEAQPPFDADAGDPITASSWHRHGSLVYGIDWLAGPGGAPGDLLGSCSFYDAQLHLWQSPSGTPSTPDNPLSSNEVA
eukprot:GGOE01002519.1.p1 GENE.GGOE01002519.1~~GGOE01002519.1.p1  ORF type:complete len:370 (+),score=68.60 GGOE01002519.1:78-1187(+)